MAPSGPHISSQLRQLIYYHLDNNLLRNALFLAGRLHAFEPRSSEAAYLLSHCLLQSGQPKHAWEICRNAGSRGTHLGCAYVYAQACLDLGNYMEGITALERSKPQWTSKNNWNKHSESRRQHLPDAAAVLCLQGKLWHAHKDIHKAVDCYVEALKLNPFLWDAFLGLSETGANVRVPNIYKMTPEMVAMLTPSASESSFSEKSIANSQPLQAQPSANHNVDPFSSTNGTSYGSSALWEKLNGSSVSVASAVLPEGLETPITQSDSDDFRVRTGPNTGDTYGEPPFAPARKSRTMQVLGVESCVDPPRLKSNSTRSRSKPKSASAEEPVSSKESTSSQQNASAMERKRTVSGHIAPTNTAQQPVEPGAPQRRSVRLFNQIRPTSKFSTSAASLGTREGREIKKAKSTSSKSRSTATAAPLGRSTTSSRKHGGESTETDSKESRSNGTSSESLNGPSRPQVPDKSKEIDALAWTLDLFSRLASGHAALCNYRCQDALQIYNSLPQNQRETPWVLSQIGRAYYEQALYSDAEKYFSRVRTIAPSQLEGMEVYSTVLWHLKNEVELAYLAHELMDTDRLAPESWCAIGNSFSLQSDHDQALKCFRRATQVDPAFAYGYTLQGHEYMSNEEYDKAQDAYRAAIKANPRHYSAWYGLGKVYERMGKLKFAEQHLRTASNINPANVVLICSIGLVLERQNNLKAALLQYSRASSLSPHSVLARLRKARTLLKLNEVNLAHIELKVLKDVAPDEPNVHYLLGKLYKMIQDKGNAIKHFTTALNLDPKAAQFIKEAMESLENPDDVDDDMT
ncbi:20S cyclosome subunit BimA/Nuc2/Cdc27 [Trichophyton violaceum]|uniref:20S cyclosome subunit BimA/Nuc2/Cdc27 n=1 Tax=Trichophyton violaceum TaxID=34388 RepID=A0A178FK26_TRIVO|nr:20S cyclosome subunit BimA/Nuc2/Cdc27 [Trichophyton violaceum]